MPKRFTMGSVSSNITKKPPKSYTYYEGEPDPISFNVPRWIKAGAYCHCSGEGDEVFRIDEFKGICAGLSKLSGHDQGWEMLHQLEPCDKTPEEIDILVAIALLQKSCRQERLSPLGCFRVLASTISVIQNFGAKETSAALKGPPEKIARKILGQ